MISSLLAEDLNHGWCTEKIITGPPKTLLFSLYNISNIAAMHQNINVEVAEIVDVMQREKKSCNIPNNAVS